MDGTKSTSEHGSTMKSMTDEKSLGGNKDTIATSQDDVDDTGRDLRPLKLHGTSNDLMLDDILTPLNPFFEICATPRKGFAVFAKTRIPRGTLILAEKPLMRITKTYYLAEHVGEAVNGLSDEGRKTFWALASAHGQDKNLCVSCYDFVFLRAAVFSSCPLAKTEHDCSLFPFCVFDLDVDMFPPHLSRY